MAVAVVGLRLRASVREACRPAAAAVGDRYVWLLGTGAAAVQVGLAAATAAAGLLELILQT